jgi:dihydroorotase
MKTLLKNASVYKDAKLQDLDILLEGDKIVAIDKKGSIAGGSEVNEIDLKNKVISSGLIDIHVHLREPGQEWKETIYSGSDAAVAGGFTDICCMPNTKPVNDTKAVTDFILDKAKVAKCKVHPIGAITLGSKGEALAPFGELQDAGCVAFSYDGRPVMNAQIMRRSLEYCKMLNAVLTVHEEDLNLAHGFAVNESPLSIRMGLKGMPEASENVMIARDIELARLTGGRVHFCHVSTARGVTLIKRAKEDGIPVTAETAPQYLYLTENEVEGYNTLAKMSMPLRLESDCEALLDGLNSGVIDCIGSDHAPHEADSKNIEFDKASFGMIGLQTTIPILFSLYHKKKITLERLLDSLGDAARNCLNMPLRKLEVGAAADISILDPNYEFVLRKEDNRSKAINTPLWGRSFKGGAYMTIVGGQIKYKRD